MSFLGTREDDLTWNRLGGWGRGDNRGGEEEEIGVLCEGN